MKILGGHEVKLKRRENPTALDSHIAAARIIRQKVEAYIAQQESGPVKQIMFGTMLEDNGLFLFPTFVTTVNGGSYDLHKANLVRQFRVLLKA